MKQESKHDSVRRVLCPECNGHRRSNKHKCFGGHTRGHIYEEEECDVCGGEGITLQFTFHRKIETKLNNTPNVNFSN
jgi:hypothetical protein